MKLANLILEENNKAIDEIINKISNECKESITMMKNNIFLYRGVGDISKGDFLFVKRRKEKRRSVNTHIIVDETFELFRQIYRPEAASRQYSTFVFPYRGKFNKEIAEYGIQYLVIPTDNCKWFQSKKVSDFFDSEIYIAIEYVINNIEQHVGESEAKEYLSSKNSLKTYLEMVEEAGDDDCEEELKKIREYFIQGIIKASGIGAYTVPSRYFNNEQDSCEVFIEGDYYALLNKSTKYGEKEYAANYLKSIGLI